MPRLHVTCLIDTNLIFSYRILEFGIVNGQINNAIQAFQTRLLNSSTLRLAVTTVTIKEKSINFFEGDIDVQMSANFTDDFEKSR